MMLWANRLVYFLRLARPLFLVGGVVFYGLGVAVALYQGVALHWPPLVLGQIAVTAIQLMTHFSNDYFDLDADRHNRTPTRWSGGSRVLAEGLLPPRTALATAILCAAVALVTILTIGLTVQPAGWSLFLLLLALFLAWEYSAPPLRLHSRGLGEATVALIVPVLTPLVGYTLQTGRPSLLPLLTVFPLACLQAAMILVINFPDAAGDYAVGKRTLVIRLGPERATRLHRGLLALAYLSLPVLIWWGLPSLAAAAVLLPLPLALWLARRMAHGAWRNRAEWSGLAFWSIGLLMATAGLELIAWLWLALA
jgi:1,4-dihydroxy-2-naphthoate octaprenyltransferase